MFSTLFPHRLTRVSSFGASFLLWALVLTLLSGASLLAAAQAQDQSQPQTAQPQTAPPAAGSQQNPNQQEARWNSKPYRLPTPSPAP